MPIELTRLAPGIYRANWSGFVTIEEVMHMTNEVIDHAAQRQEVAVITIFDLTHVVRIPFDIYTMQHLTQAAPCLAGYVMARPTKMAQVLGRMVGRLSQYPIEFAATDADALIVAQRLRQRVNSV